MWRLAGILCVSVVCAESEGREGRVWRPLSVPPLACGYPCKSSRDISAWFELGVPLRDLDGYYVHINRTFPANSVTEVVFDTEAKVTLPVRSNGNKFSRVALSKGENFTIRFFKQLHGLSFIVKGTTGSIPYLKGLTVDDQELCDDPDVEFLRAYSAETKSVPEDDELQWYAESKKSKDSNCGQRAVGSSDPSINGPTKPGDWPWHAALYRISKQGNTQYICGGTLISKNFVLTAAHCTSLRGQILLPEQISVALGKYNLKIGDKESQVKAIERIIIADDYDYTRFFSDIALLKLRSTVQFTEFIQPACVWHTGADEALQNTSIVGNIMGWGYDNDDAPPTALQQASLPMVSAETCIRSYPNFYVRFTNLKTFCAGYKNNGTSACNGDSGGGYQVFVPSVNGEPAGAWHVRGILSLLPSKVGQAICDSDQYNVFTDVRQYLRWIQSHLEE